MKQLVFMLILTLAGMFGAVIHPFYGVLLYYGLAFLRPQALWGWALPQGVRWSLIAALVTAGGIVLALPRKTWRLRFNGVAVLILLFGLLVLVSVMLAQDPKLGQAWAVEYGKVFVMLIIASLVIDRLRHVHLIGGMILLCIGYIAWEMNARYVFEGSMDILTRGYAGFDNNGVGLLMAMGIPFAYALARMLSPWWLRIACLGAGVLMINALMLSFSRGAMVSAVVGIGWLISQHRPRLHAAGFALICVLAVGILAGPQVRQRFLSIGNYHGDLSAQSRMSSWTAAWKMAWDHPWTGVGVRNSNHFGINYGSDHIGRTTHNQFLQTAADSGIPAMLVYLAICVWSMWRLQQVRRMTGNGRRGPEDDGPHDAPPLAYDRSTAVIALGIQGSLLTFMAGGLFLSLEVFELPWLLMVLAGALLPLVRETHGKTLADASEKKTETRTRPAPPTAPAVDPPGGMALIPREFAG